MLDCDSEELLDTQKRSGPLDVMTAGRNARAKKLTTLAGIKHDPALYDLVILGTPIWAYALSSAVRTFITTNKSKFKQVAFFCTQGTQGSTERQQVFAEMEALCDRHPVNTLALNNTEVERGAYQDKLRQFADELQAP
ncbi:MAG: flavodoxin family protein [Halobacteriota archaeon]